MAKETTGASSVALSEFEINGRRVKLRDRMTAQMANRLPALINAAADDNADLLAWARVFRLVVEEWDFEGKPDDLRSYEGLDLYEEFYPLLAQVSAFCKQKMGYASAKN